MSLMVKDRTMFVLKIAEVMCFVLIDTGARVARVASGASGVVRVWCSWFISVVGKKNEIVDALATRPRKNLLQIAPNQSKN